MLRCSECQARPGIDCLVLSDPLPTANGSVDIGGIDLDEAGESTGSLGRDHGRAEAAKRAQIMPPRLEQSRWHRRSWRPAWLSVRLELLVAVFAKPGKPAVLPDIRAISSVRQLDIVDVGGVTRLIDEDQFVAAPI